MGQALSASNQNQLGLRIIIKPPSPPTSSSPPLTIVFVHGLGGSSTSTWTGLSKKFNWPASIPKIKGLQNARIMTFGYDSRRKKIKHNLGFSVFAEELVKELWCYYREYGYSPTIFVAHSLGGLIVKKALITASHIPRYNQILQETIGIAFFGTPHRGTDLHEISKSILDFSFPGKKYVKYTSLEHASQSIKDINDAFGKYIGRLKLASFWETIGLKSNGEIVVSEFSATLGSPVESALPLNGDHSTMVTYSSEQDDEFQVVSEVISYLSRDAPHKNPLPRPIFHLPYSRNPSFTGRDDLIQTIRDKIVDIRMKHKIALHGHGGVGKTQIALEYCFRYRSNYRFVFWLSCVDRIRFLSGLKEIAARTGNLTPNSSHTLEEIVKSVLQWFESNTRWLLVLDGLEDINIVAGYLPQTHHSDHILITTRNSHDQLRSEGVQINTMEPHESVSLLITRANLQTNQKEVEHEARNLVTELKYFPLAIVQAASYICTSHDIFEYLETYRGHRNISHRDPFVEAVSTTWKISYSRLQINSKALIGLLAFLNPDEIHLEFLRAGSPGLYSELASIVNDDSLLQETLRDLESYSLIRIENDRRKVIIHRIVQYVVAHNLDSEHQTLLIAQVLSMALHAFPSTLGDGDRRTCRLYYAQVMGILTNIEEDQNWSLTISANASDFQVLSYRVANYLYMDGYQSYALKLYNKLHEIRKSLVGPEHPDVLKSMAHLAMIYSGVGQLNEALKLMDKCLHLRTNILGIEHADTLQTMYELAELQLKLNEPEKAEEMHERCLKTRKRVFGPDHVDTLQSMYGLAVTYASLRKLKKAIPLHENCLEVRRRDLGSAHPQTLQSIHELGDMYLQGSRQTKAKKLHEEWLEAQRKAFGPEHPTVLRSMYDLAEKYGVYILYRDAVIMHEECLQIRKRVLGPLHPDTLESIFGLGWAYVRIGQNAKGYKLHEEWYEGRKKVFGPGHLPTLKIWDQLDVSHSNVAASRLMRASGPIVGVVGVEGLVFPIQG